MVRADQSALRRWGCRFVARERYTTDVKPALAGATSAQRLPFREPPIEGCVLDDVAAQLQDASAPDLYKAVFEAASIGLALITADGGTFRDANPSLCRLLGHEPGSLRGVPLAALFGERGLPLTSGIRRWRKADGRVVDLRVRLSREAAASAERGDIVAVVESVDADELVRAEQNRDALVAAGLGEWRWETATGQVSLSRRAGQILGYPPGRSVTWAAMRAQVEEEDAERWRAKVVEANARRAPCEFETRFRRGSDGQAVTVALRGQPIFSADGLMTGMVGVVQDVTTRVAARRALADREERLRVATSIAALGIFEWHVFEDRATWENERMYAIFGRTPEDGALGKSGFFAQALHPDDGAAFRGAIMRALRDDTILHASGRIRRHCDGAWRIIEMAGRFERDAPQRPPRRLIGVVADVTDRCHAQERQTLLIRELHHRVKNTLATVQAIVGSTARTASSIDTFYEAFVGRIKSLSHTHSVLTEDTWQTANLHDLLVNELRPYAETESDGRLEDRITLDGPTVDLASEIAVPIGMAIHELTTNAAKHGALSNRTGRVSVVWEVQPGGEAGILVFEWRESEGPAVSSPSRQGFGSRLLQRVLTTQVQADVRSDYAPEGFRLVMRAPLPGRNAALNPLA